MYVFRGTPADAWKEGGGFEEWIDRFIGASLDHLVLAMCFGAFVLAAPAHVFSLSTALRRRRARAAAALHDDSRREGAAAAR